MTEMDIKPKIAEPVKILRPFKKLRDICHFYEEAQVSLESAIGVPICIPKCGKCCELTTATMMVIEAKYAASRLLAEVDVLNKVVSVCEGWLLERHPALQTYAGTKIFHDVPTITKAFEEVNFIHLKSQCPFLTSDKRCLIHIARPILCRAYGVTRLPAYFCPRPTGKGETRDSRMHIGKPVTIELKELIKEFRDSIPVTDSNYGFAPALIYMILKPQTLAKYIFDNKIATAKLMQFREEPSVLDQDQLNEVWAMETMVKI